MAILGAQLTRCSSLLAKLEGTYGVDATPATTDAIMTFGEVKPSLELDVQEPDALSSSGSPCHPPIAGRHYRKIAFSTPLKGSGAAGTAPRIGCLLQACGLAAATVSETSVTYTSAISGKKSVTIYYYENGTLQKLTGAVGTFQIEGGAGRVPTINWDFSGILTAESDAALVAPTFEATDGLPQFGGATLGAIALLIDKWTVDLGAEIATRPAIAAASGYQGFVVTAHKPTATITAEKELVANHPFEANARGSVAADLVLTEGAAGNLWTLTLNDCVAKSLGYGSNAGVRTVDLTLAPHDGSTSGDAFTLAFT
jgi:hypothetical protein